jgi:hypothetical protein
MKHFAQAVGLRALDENRIGTREHELGIEEGEWFGSHHPEHHHSLWQHARAELKEDRATTRLFWFLQSDFWYTDNYTRIKKLARALHQLGQQWVERGDSPRVQAYRYVLGEGVVLFAVCLLYLLRDVYEMEEAEAQVHIRQRLAAGAARYEELERMSARMNDYVRAVLTEVNGVSGAVGAPNFTPEPPEYTPALVDLVMRLRGVAAAGSLPRFADLAVFQFGIRDLPADPALYDYLGIADAPSVEKQLFNVVRFMSRHLGVPDHALKRVLPVGRVTTTENTSGISQSPGSAATVVQTPTDQARTLTLDARPAPAESRSTGDYTSRPNVGRRGRKGGTGLPMPKESVESRVLRSSTLPTDSGEAPLQRTPSPRTESASDDLIGAELPGELPESTDKQV